MSLGDGASKKPFQASLVAAAAAAAVAALVPVLGLVRAVCRRAVNRLPRRTALSPLPPLFPLTLQADRLVEEGYRQAMVVAAPRRQGLCHFGVVVAETLSPRHRGVVLKVPAAADMFREVCSIAVLRSLADPLDMGGGSGGVCLGRGEAEGRRALDGVLRRRGRRPLAPPLASRASSPEMEMSRNCTDRFWRWRASRALPPDSSWPSASPEGPGGSTQL